jgi:hypothetical protein
MPPQAYEILFLIPCRPFRIKKRVGEMMALWCQREGVNLGLVGLLCHLHISCKDKRYCIFSAEFSQFSLGY